MRHQSTTAEIISIQNKHFKPCISQIKLVSQSATLHAIPGLQTMSNRFVEHWNLFIEQLST